MSEMFFQSSSPPLSFADVYIYTRLACPDSSVLARIRIRGANYACPVRARACARANELGNKNAGRRCGSLKVFNYRHLRCGIINELNEEMQFVGGDDFG